MPSPRRTPSSKKQPDVMGPGGSKRNTNQKTHQRRGNCKPCTTAKAQSLSDQDARRAEILNTHKIQSVARPRRAQERAVSKPTVTEPTEISPAVNPAPIPFADVQSLLQLSQLIQT